MNRTFAMVIRRRMREENVTIRALAAAMQLTMTRVREVRNTGKAPVWANASERFWMLDWFDGIKRASISGKELT